MPGVNRKTQIDPPVDNGQPGVIYPCDFRILHILYGDKRLFLHSPVFPVIAERNAEIASTESAPGDMVVVVAENHDVLSLIFGDACVEDAIRRIGDIPGGKNRCAVVVSTDHIAGFKFRHHLRHMQTFFLLMLFIFLHCKCKKSHNSIIAKGR